MSEGNRVSQPGVIKSGRRDGMTGSFISKVIFSVFYNLVFFGGLLFLPAGTFYWPRAWVMLVAVLLLIAAFIGIIVFIPLDVFRFHLMGEPDPLISSLGLILFAAGWWIISLVFKENAFAAPVVKYQEERRQRVIDTGVYSVVRHPMYAGAILWMVGMTLWLESYAATLLVIVLISLVVVRIVFEERFLKRELKGYEDYTKRVRYRLIPFIW
jgi:protein-S-isoprenylcysteine O-methyltransferase Ste14